MVSQPFVVSVKRLKRLNEFLHSFSGFLLLLHLTFLCLDQYHSNLLKFMSKSIPVYSCVLDKISFVVFFPGSQRELAVQTSIYMIEIPFADRTGICQILPMNANL